MKQDNLLLNYEFLKKCNLATVSKTDDKLVLRGVCIQDRKEKDNCYRYYIGCDGSMLVGYKLKINECQINEIILNLHDFKITKEKEKQINDNQNLLLLEKVKDSKIRFTTSFGNIFAIDGIYPNYLHLFAKKYKIADKFVSISLQKHTILNKFWKNNSITDNKLSLFEKTYFINSDVKDETKVPLFNFEKVNDKILKFSLVMPIYSVIDFDLKELKKFDF